MDYRLERERGVWAMVAYLQSLGFGVDVPKTQRRLEKFSCIVSHVPICDAVVLRGGFAIFENPLNRNIIHVRQERAYFMNPWEIVDGRESEHTN
jgi:hypothetical protein